MTPCASTMRHSLSSVSDREERGVQTASGEPADVKEGEEEGERRGSEYGYITNRLLQTQSSCCVLSLVVRGF